MKLDLPTLDWSLEEIEATIARIKETDFNNTNLNSPRGIYLEYLEKKKTEALLKISPLYRLLEGKDEN